MAKSVFYSFHYERDNWRVQQVQQMGALEEGAAFTPQDWEKVRYQTDAAIERWIHNQMAYTRAVIVMVGRETAQRDWVRYEIEKAWNEKRPLVGVRIHALRDTNQRTDTSGVNPFQMLRLPGGVTVADYVDLHNPSGYTSQDVYADIKRNLSGWVDRAYRRS
jgi:MTH538 TIR-like domain (DUF1863)